MESEEHKEHHIRLHKAFDELFADYIGQHPNQVSFLDMPLRQLLEWSHEQTLNPTGQHADEAGQHRRIDPPEELPIVDCPKHIKCGIQLINQGKRKELTVELERLQAINRNNVTELGKCLDALEGKGE